MLLYTIHTKDYIMYLLVNPKFVYSNSLYLFLLMCSVSKQCCHACQRSHR